MVVPNSACTVDHARTHSAPQSSPVVTPIFGRNTLNLGKSKRMYPYANPQGTSPAHEPDLSSIHTLTPAVKVNSTIYSHIVRTEDSHHDVI